MPTRGGTVSRHTIACKSRLPTILIDPTRDHKAASKTTEPNSIPAPPDVGRRSSESRPYYKAPMFCLCSQRHQSRRKLSVQHMFWMGARKCSGLLNAAQYRRSSQSGGDTRVNTHTKIQELLHPELHHSS